MTTFDYNLYLSPMSPSPGDFYPLNYAATTSITTTQEAAYLISIPIDGTIEAYGFYVISPGTAVTTSGGIFVASDTTGTPTGANYGGSSTESISITASGWNWITLGTSATASKGDLAYLRIMRASSTFTIPNSSIRTTQRLPRRTLSTTNGASWGTPSYGTFPFAVKYSTGKVYGWYFPYLLAYGVTSTSSPDEIGNVYTPPFDIEVVGITGTFSCTTDTPGFIIRIYDSLDNILREITLNDLTPISHLGATAQFEYYIEPLWLTGGESYKITYSNVGTGNTLNVSTILFYDNSNKDMTPAILGDNFELTYRTASGEWTTLSSGVMDLGFITSRATITDTTAAGEGSNLSYAYIGG